MNGEVGVLNVGAGDTKLSFDPSNQADRIRAARIVKDMSRSTIEPRSMILIKLFAASILASAIGGFVSWGMTPRGGEIICTDSGKMSVHFSRVQGIDTKAVVDALFYLCDQTTIGFGYNNQKIRPINIDH